MIDAVGLGQTVDGQADGIVMHDVVRRRSHRSDKDTCSRRLVVDDIAGQKEDVLAFQAIVTVVVDRVADDDDLIRDRAREASDDPVELAGYVVAAHQCACPRDVDAIARLIGERIAADGHVGRTADHTPTPGEPGADLVVQPVALNESMIIGKAQEDAIEEITVDIAIGYS